MGSFRCLFIHCRRVVCAVFGAVGLFNKLQTQKINSSPRRQTLRQYSAFVCNEHRKQLPDVSHQLSNKAKFANKLSVTSRECRLPLCTRDIKMPLAFICASATIAHPSVHSNSSCSTASLSLLAPKVGGVRIWPAGALHSIVSGMEHTGTKLTLTLTLNSNAHPNPNPNPHPHPHPHPKPHPDPNPNPNKARQCCRN